jgi:hypothetical protein
MQAPKYQAPSEDPEITATKARADADNIAAMQGTAAIDTASIMARYGTRVALAGAVPQAATVAPPPGVR